MRTAVALPTEGVDRNLGNLMADAVSNMSPSPRRAWIEIACVPAIAMSESVALPTEGVDRNGTVDWGAEYA